LKRVRIAGHPIHPALAHFPVALWSVTWAWDVLGAWTGAAVWWQTGFWCLVAGTSMGVLAAVAGVLDFAALEESHPAEGAVVRHMLLVGTAFAVFVGELLVRGGPQPPAAERLYAVLALSTVGLALLAAGGWYGGRLVYHYGVGRD
jgi:uncharacterized membrane protein